MYIDLLQSQIGNPMKLNCIAIIDSRGVIDPNDNYTFNRHIRYAMRLKEKSDLRLVVVSSKKSNFIYKKNNLFFIGIESNNYFSPKFVKKSVEKLIEYNLHPKLLVSGDPWESFEVSKYVSRKMNQKFCIPIQAQLHADVFDPKWVNYSVVRKIRLIWCRRNLKKADSIRLVSQTQLHNFPKSYHNSNKIIICPVPLNMISNPPNFNLNRPNSVGFIGRLENDRGLDELISIMDKLQNYNKNLQIVIAGEGSKSKYLIKRLGRILSNENIIYLKQLDPENMLKAWSKIGVLISTAKTESYGRVMREAACYGIPIMTVMNSGSNLLSKEIPMSWLEFISSNDKSEEIAMKFEKLRKQKTNSKYLEQTLFRENTNVSNLIDSWIEVSKIQCVE